MRRRPLSLHLSNLSGYDTSDLRRFLYRGLRVFGVRGRIEVVVTAAKARSRGCALVGGRSLSLSLAPPSYNATPAGFMRRLARLLEHESAHLKGLEHEEMGESVLYSEGPIPSWARGMRIRYRRRAPDQMMALRGRRRAS